jgi:DNA-directed RNA polymerase specialized sigma24 family protein
MSEIEQSKPLRQRKDVVPPANLKAGMSLFDYLHNCQPPLDKKLVDIACSQTGTPESLRKEAAQDIYLMWCEMFPDVLKYKPGQIAAYAHRMARHAALRCRREIGAPVRLPGSAFRKRKDGSSYVTPGVLADALDWNELESWFSTGDGEEAGSSLSGPSLDLEGVSQLLSEDEQMVSEEDEEVRLRNERVELLKDKAQVLTERQSLILQMLIDGATFAEILRDMNIKKGVLMREVAIASEMLGPMDY